MALTKVIGSGVGELTNKVGLGLSSPAAALHVQTSTDGTGLSGDDIYVARFHNQEATSDRSFGLDIQAGSSTTDQALRIKDHDGTNTLMIVDGLGHVTKPKQPAFNVTMDGDQNNMTVGGSDNTIIQFDDERFDQNADFNTSTHTFTAPVTGRYLLSYSIRMQNIDTASTSVSIILTTSNKGYATYQDMAGFASDFDYYPFTTTLLVDMDVNDTAKVEYYVNGGAAQNDISQYSYFTGHLVC